MMIMTHLPCIQPMC